MSVAGPSPTDEFEPKNEWPTNPVTITCTLIDCILFTITVVIYISLCYRSCQYHKASKSRNPHNEIPIHQSILNGTLFACTLLILAIFVTVVYTINSQLNFLRGVGRIALIYVQVIAIGVGKTLCHLIFVRRLQLAFEESPALAYPKWVFYLFYTAMIIVPTAAIVIVLILLLSNPAGSFSWIAAVSFSLDAMAAIVVLLMFVQKLRTVFIQRKQHSVQNVHDVASVSMEPMDKGLVETVTRLTLLSLLNALSSFFLFLVFVIRAIEERASKMDDGKDVEYWRIVYAANVFFILSAMVNIMMLYLVLIFARRHYEIFCKALHNLLSRCCKYGFTKALLRHHQKVTMTELAAARSASSFDSETTATQVAV